jgi:hypothetical protein
MTVRQSRVLHLPEDSSALCRPFATFANIRVSQPAVETGIGAHAEVRGRVYRTLNAVVQEKESEKYIGGNR